MCALLSTVETVKASLNCWRNLCYQFISGTVGRAVCCLSNLQSAPPAGTDTALSLSLFVFVRTHRLVIRPTFYPEFPVCGQGSLIA